MLACCALLPGLGTSFTKLSHSCLEMRLPALMWLFYGLEQKRKAERCCLPLPLQLQKGKPVVPPKKGDDPVANTQFQEFR